MKKRILSIIVITLFIGYSFKLTNAATICVTPGGSNCQNPPCQEKCWQISDCSCVNGVQYSCVDVPAENSWTCTPLVAYPPGIWDNPGRAISSFMTGKRIPIGGGDILMFDENDNFLAIAHMSN